MLNLEELFDKHKGELYHFTELKTDSCPDLCALLLLHNLSPIIKGVLLMVPFRRYIFFRKL
jgi:hypothetical protein